MRRSLALSMLVLASFASQAYAVGQARITGKVIDSVTKEPIKDATITVDAVEAKSYHNEHKVSKKDGTYAIAVLDGTIRYKFVFSAPGYAPYEETMKLTLAGGAPNIKTVELVKGGSAAGSTAANLPPEQQAQLDPAVVAFNAGAALANQGQDNEALAKFEEAVAAKPDLIAAHQAIARVAMRLKNHAKAIEAANKSLALDEEDTDMYAILYDAYLASGDKAKAAEVKKKLPANPRSLFNDAAKAINAGKDPEAESLLKQAVAADPNFAQAYYELGMVYVRTSKNAEAKEALLKYLELEPKGKDAATAKEMLNYVK